MDKRLRILKDLLWVVALCGLVGGVLRMWFGLGATTHLTDGVPWGLWKVLNMVAGVALSTSGFTIGFLVYVLRIERFRPLMKPAILIAFLGYGSSCLALAFDIGLPHRFWHPFVMWNHHSFLFEVFWCVMIYFTVTFIEILGPILERYKAERAVNFLHYIGFGVVVLGISLSSLHHSSLGSLFLITPLRLHALWYSSWLPLFFILSAMGAGLMVVVLARIAYLWLFSRIPTDEINDCAVPPSATKAQCTAGDTLSRVLKADDQRVLTQVATIAASILGVYLILKVVDLFRSGAWSALTAGTWESWLYGGELALGLLLPIVLLAIPRSRRTPVGLTTAAFLAATGLLVNRMNVGILGYYRDASEIYLPSLIEWAVSLGVVAAAGLAFLFIVENFAIFAVSWHKTEHVFHSSFDSFSHVWNAALSNSLHRVSLIAVIILPLAWMTMYPSFNNSGVADDTITPPTGLDATRAVLRIDGNRDGVHTDFQHLAHQQRMGGEASCQTCHHISLPGDHSTPCSRCHRSMTGPTEIFDHLGHMAFVVKSEKIGGVQPQNRSCVVCHATGQVKGAASAKDCLDCHRQDMWPTETAPDSPIALAAAGNYQQAMHRNCLDCHRQEATAQQKPGLAECGACHPSLQPRQAEFVQLTSALRSETQTSPAASQ